MIEGQVYSEMDILEGEGKREEKTKILLAYWRAGREDTKESTKGSAESLHDFKFWSWASQGGLDLLPVSGTLS